MKVYQRGKYIDVKATDDEIKRGDVVMSKFVLDSLDDEGNYINFRGDTKRYDLDTCGGGPEDHIVGINSEGKLCALGYSGDNLKEGCKKVVLGAGIKIPYFYALK